MQNIIREIPIWKWALLLICGFIFFLVLNFVAQMPCMYIEEIWLNCVASIASAVLLIVIYILIVRFIEKRRVEEFALNIALKQIGKGFLIGIAYFSIIVIVLFAIGSYRVESIQFNYIDILIIFLLYLIVAIGEELIFRGILFRLIDQRWNAVVAYISSALIFGFMHLPQGTVWSSVAIAIEAGLLFGAVYKYSGNLWMPIGIHWSWNFFEGPVYGFFVSGTNSENVDTIIKPIITGPDIITGGSFGPEASIVSVVLGSVLSIWFISKSRKKLN